jgi:hypothetical protein
MIGMLELNILSTMSLSLILYEVRGNYVVREVKGNTDHVVIHVPQD